MGFGKLLKKASSPLSIVANPMIGLNALGAKHGLKALGLNLDDEQGAYATPEEAYKRAYQKAAADYKGGMSEAEKGLQESAITRGLYGAGGLQEQLGREQTQLSGQGFQLTPEDMTAYGQTAGNIARQFGQQEQAATQSLARRGLASGSSGAAGATFSGLAGNKNEMLARAQTDIAQRRYHDTMNRLQQVRNQMQSMGAQGAEMARQRYQDKLGGLAGAAGMESQMYGERRQALADKEAAVKPGLMSTIGTGLQAGIGQLATQAPSIGLGAATGGQYGTLSTKQKTATLKEANSGGGNYQMSDFGFDTPNYFSQKPRGGLWG